MKISIKKKRKGYQERQVEEIDRFQISIIISKKKKT